MDVPPDEPAAPKGDGGLVRVRLDLGYDGTAFAGWAAQPGQRTVQDEVERGLATVFRLAAPPRLTVAGRTDAGVHARGQVAHADLPAGTWDAVPPARLLRGLAAVLPADVRVFAAAPAPAGFDARFAASSRVYGYRVDDGPAGVHPLRRHDTLWHPRPLDPAAVRAAAAGLLGEHDFAAYCRRREGATTIRTLLRLDWTRDADGAWLALVEADAFCHSMVRSLVGALLAAGDGRCPPAFPASLLARSARAGEVQVAPPHGLTLLEVRYPPDDRLAERARQARARRGPA